MATSRGRDVFILGKDFHFTVSILFVFSQTVFSFFFQYSGHKSPQILHIGPKKKKKKKSTKTLLQKIPSAVDVVSWMVASSSAA